MNRAREAAEKLVESRIGRHSYDKGQILGATEDGYRVGYERGLRDGDIVAEQEGRREDNDAWEKEVERLNSVIENLTKSLSGSEAIRETLEQALRGVRGQVKVLVNRSTIRDNSLDIIADVLGEPEEKPKQRTLKELREAKKLSVKQVDWAMTAARVLCDPSAFLDSGIADWEDSLTPVCMCGDRKIVLASLYGVDVSIINACPEVV